MRVDCRCKPNHQSQIINPFVMVRNHKGFTLIELVVVVSLIVMMIGLTMPKIRNTLLSDALKRTALRMVGLVKNLRDEAVREQRTYGLRLDMVQQQYWVGFTAMTEEEQVQARKNAEKLPPNVEILDVWFKEEGKISEGEAVILFFKKGYIQPSAIHLGDDDGRRFTVVLSPFGGKVAVLEKYVDFENEE
ncbi:MAG: prepilin-type N-terminal cleavage/methylation domain-containing protein [Deltaproteobacteria bacterium]|nr:prepilin-type N-terminal cleavage/methylation domain-containing protein [Deltaproteobacteria bacterium]